jgi:hypothetical protein
MGKAQPPDSVKLCRHLPLGYQCFEVFDSGLVPMRHLISKKPQPTEEQAHVVSHPTASM